MTLIVLFFPINSLIFKNRIVIHVHYFILKIYIFAYRVKSHLFPPLSPTPFPEVTTISRILLCFYLSVSLPDHKHPGAGFFVSKYLTGRWPQNLGPEPVCEGLKALRAVELREMWLEELMCLSRLVTPLLSVFPLVPFLRIYEQLPEIQKKKEEEKRRSEYKSYRLRAQLYKKVSQP